MKHDYRYSIEALATDLIAQRWYGMEEVEGVLRTRYISTWVRAEMGWAKNDHRRKAVRNSGQIGSLSAVSRILRIPGLLLIGLVRLYRWTIVPMLGRRCRFEPSCSEYFIASVRKYGAIRGAAAGPLADLPLQPREPRRVRSAVTGPWEPSVRT